MTPNCSGTRYAAAPAFHVPTASHEARDALPAPVVSARYQRRDLHLRRILALVDLAALLVGILVTAAVATSREDDPTFLLMAAAAAPFALPLLGAYHLYDRDAKRISHSTIDELPALFHAVVIYSLLQCGWLVLSPADNPSLREELLLGASTLVLLTAFRAVARTWLSRRLAPERAIVVGDGPSARALERKMRAHPEYNVTPVGLVRTRGRGALPSAVSDVAALVGDHDADRLILSHTDLQEHALLDLIADARRLGVKVSILPQVFDALGPSVEVDELEGVTLLGINQPVLSRSSRALKRALDLVGASVLLVVVAPLMAVVAIAIRVDSRGPVFFRQDRVGRGGHRFRLLKFRTMLPDAEARRASLMAQSADPHWLHLQHDPRITRVGRVLRRSSLDELPQLWNVVRGEMSLVGPRPLIESEDSLIDGWGRNRLDLTPGMTGLWQVLGRTTIPFEEMVKLDYLYVTNWSLWGDIRLLLKTFSVLLNRRGAN